MSEGNTVIQPAGPKSAPARNKKKSGQKKLPAFQFYPGDWSKDPNLRRCSHAAKGVWIDLLCLMFESQERGVLITSQRAWDDEEIALAVGGDNATVRACLQELILKGVARRRADGALYSKRLVQDEQTRQKCVDAGQKGGNPHLLRLRELKQGVNPDPKGEDNPELTSSVSSSSSDYKIKKEIESQIPCLGKPQNLEEALAYARDRSGYPSDVVRHWYASRDSAGWERVNGTLVRNWRSDLDAWVLTAARQPASPPKKRFVSPIAPTFVGVRL